MKTPLKALIIEGYEGDAAMEVHQMEEDGFSVTFRRVDSPDQMRSALEKEPWDVIISDFFLPRFTATEGLSILKSSGLDIPFIVVSRGIGEEAAVAVVKAGAQEYIMKDNLSRLGYVVKREIADVQDRYNRWKAIEALRQSEERHRMLFELESDALVLIDQETGKILEANHAASFFYGYVQNELIGKKISDISAEPEQSFSAGDEGTIVLPVRYHRRKDGSVFPVEITVQNFLWKEKEVHLAAIRDVTERVHSEGRLRESEAYFRTLIETSPDAIIITDTKFRITYISRKAYEMFNIPEDSEDVMGTSVVEWLHQDQVKVVKEWMAEMVTGKVNSETREYHLIKYDGAQFWGEISSSPLFNSNREFAGILVVCRDITGRKHAEAALRESEEMYRTLLNASPEGIVIMDLQGRITEISDLVLSILGSDDKTDFIGKFFYYFTSRQESKKLKELLEKILSEDQDQNLEIRLVRKDLSQFIGEISITLIRDSDRIPRSFMAIIRDISRKKSEEQQLIHTARMAGLGEIATGIAHEINQPLNTITLSLENIFEEFSSKKGDEKKYLKNKSDKIHDNILKIRNIIDHIRYFSRAQDDYIHSSFDMHESIRNAISMISEKFNHDGIALKLNLDSTIMPIIGNTYRFEQVILNLLINASDALEEKKKLIKDDFRKSVKIKTCMVQHFIQVHLSDNGIGINEDELDKVFLPFYSTKQIGQGTGLGLSISYGIIKEMNGTLEIKSKYSVGTTIKISIPAGEKTRN